MGSYDRLADLTLTVDSTARVRHERDTSSGFTRATTVVELHGDEGVVGRGEDVTYDTEDHDALAAVPDRVFDDALAGTYDFAEFSATLDDVDLFPTKAPERESSRHYRRWAFESAGLDLALRQADTDLASALGRERAPVNFVVSTRLGDPPTTDRVEAIRGRRPDLGLKLDPTSDWTDELIADLAATGAVRLLDLKGHYVGTEVDQPPDPDLYERVIEGFPDAVIEDPALTDATRGLVEPVRERISWDAPITGVESVRDLPFEPRWLNVKPSRFGTVESLLETIEYARERDVTLYGGGQFELDVGRAHVQTLAATFYPDGPNDVAPGGYNLPDLPADLPGSPLAPTPDARGLDF
jgi:L-alanine-DL-glutamate epimerase-like enolase superfamily enzyme